MADGVVYVLMTYSDTTEVVGAYSSMENAEKAEKIYRKSSNFWPGDETYIDVFVIDDFDLM